VPEMLFIEIFIDLNAFYVVFIIWIRFFGDEAFGYGGVFPT